MAESPHVRLTLSNRPENVVLVRQALGGFADSVGLDSVELNDVSTAVSEACNNVVMHAYDGEEGPLEVEICSRPPGLHVVVRDRGSGIADRGQAQEPSEGIGVPVIQALADSVEFAERAGGGTEVRMQFAALGAAGAEREAEHGPGSFDAIGDEELPNTIALAAAPISLTRTVLPRVACALAARAHFSTDRISDVRLIVDALAAHSEGSVSASDLSVKISVEPRKLAFRLGPLRPGRADGVLQASASAGIGPLLERLSEGHEVSPFGTSEILALQIAQHR